MTPSLWNLPMLPGLTRVPLACFYLGTDLNSISQSRASQELLSSCLFTSPLTWFYNPLLLTWTHYSSQTVCGKVMTDFHVTQVKDTFSLSLTCEEAEQHNGKQSMETWGQTPLVLLLTPACVIPNKGLHPSVLHFLYPQNGNDNSIYTIVQV